MTSRERLMAVLQHKIPDRVPVSTYDMHGWHFDPRDGKPQADPLARYVDTQLFGMYRNGWWNREESYKPLMEYIRENADCIYMTDVPTVNRWAAEHTRIDQHREGISTYTSINLDTPKGPLKRTFRVDDGVYTAWETEHLLKDDEDIERYLSVPFDPVPVDASHVKEQDAFLGDNGIMLVDINDPICEVFGLFDFSDFLMRAFTEPEVISKLLDFTWERQKYFLQQMLEQGAGPLYRVAGPEVCTPPYLPNELFKKFVTPYDKQIAEMIHKYNCYLRIHAHGRVKTVMNEFLEIGADAIDPVESPAYGDGDLEMWEAKQLSQGKLCIFGNIQLKDLEQLDATQMREVVKKCVLEGKPGGNFVALPTATPLNVPLSPRCEENFRIFIDTVHEFGKY